MSDESMLISAGVEDIHYQQAWSKVKLIKLRRRIAQLENDLVRYKQTKGELQAYKAAYTIATRALEEVQDSRLRLLKVLRRPASEAVIGELSTGARISLSEAASSMERLDVVIELARLGIFALKEEVFVLTDKGQALIRELGTGDEHASGTSPKLG
jgi:hypothetical protein